MSYIEPAESKAYGLDSLLLNPEALAVDENSESQGAGAPLLSEQAVLAITSGDIVFQAVTMNTYTGTNLDDTITGSTGDDVINGLDGHDILVGDAGNDTIDGGLGNDIINGGAGNDTMTGGLGDDLFIVDSAGDSVIENPGEGLDTVRSYINFTLGLGMDRLELWGGSNLNGTGNGGANDLIGNAGDNILDGGAANDYLYGGAGSDTLIGGSGNDTYAVDASTDVIIELAGAGAGYDRVYSVASDYTLSANIEILELTGTGNINGTGNALANMIGGNSGSNILDGGAGNDLINGRGGGDILRGGLGDDRIIINDLTDVAIELAGQGTADEIQSLVANYLMPDHFERMLLLGTGDINGFGNSANNFMQGNLGNNTINGGAGDDFLNGAQGSDTLYGGLGNDIMFLWTDTDVASENAGEGTDTVRSQVTTILGDHIENLQLWFHYNIDGTGNDLNNTLIGNLGSNTLTGLGGNDLLDGGVGGINTLIGGLGNDTYVVRTVNDTVQENAGEGSDLVRSLVDSTLGNHLEHLTLLSGDIDGTGNNLDNVITGSDGVNTLSGLDGNDTLNGLDGDDVIIGGTGYDRLVGGGGNDFLDGGEGSDTYLGFDGNFGQDIITDVSGNDILELGSFTSDDIVSWQGIDTDNNSFFDDLLIDFGLGNQLTIKDYFDNTVTASASAGLIEKLVFSDRHLTYNDITDFVPGFQLVGTDSDDNLEGGALQDELDGGAGNDLLSGGGGSDQYTFSVQNFGFDTIDDTSGNNDHVDLSSFDLEMVQNWQAMDHDSNSFVDALHLDFGAGKAITVENYFDNTSTDVTVSGVGNGLIEHFLFSDFSLDWSLLKLLFSSNIMFGTLGHDVLTGTSNRDFIFGLSGNDTIDGLEGNDYLFGGSGNDVINGGSGDDYLVAGYGSDTLNGDDGNDTLISGGPGSNNGLIGGLGNDTLIGSATFMDRYIFEDGWGNDVIIDDLGLNRIIFEALDTDITIDLREESSVPYIVTDGTNTIELQGNIDNFEFWFSTSGSSPHVADILYYGHAGNDFVVGDSEDNYGVMTLFGYDGDDHLVGSQGDDYIDGGAGNDDTLAGREGNDIIIGGEGDDTLSGQTGNDTLDGGAGNDTLKGGSGVDQLNGGSGNDGYYYFQSQGSAGYDSILDASGISDFIHLHDHLLANMIFAPIDSNGDQMVDQLLVGLGDGSVILIDEYFDNSNILGSLSNEGFGLIESIDVESTNLSFSDVVNSLPVSILTGSDAHDELHGTELDEIIIGKGEGDTIYGNGGNDIIYGSRSGDIRDRLYGDDGNDVIIANGDGTGDGFLIRGGDDNDYLIGSTEDGTFYGDAGNDVIIVKGTENSVDIVFSEGWGNDTIYVNEDQTKTTFNFQHVEADLILNEYTKEYTDGTNTAILNGDIELRSLKGGKGNDVIHTNAWFIDGREGNDIIHGGDGESIIHGYEGNDIIYGNGGREQITGGIGDDVMYGGEGDDSYLFQSGWGHDTIVDDSSELNMVMLSGVHEDLTINLTSSDLQDEVSNGIDSINWENNAINRAWGGRGNDLINANNNLNKLAGYRGNDIIYGFDGDDELNGGTFNNNSLIADGNDQLYGGSGNDTYIFNSRDGDFDSDIIFDESGTADAIDLTNLNYSDVVVSWSALDTNLDTFIDELVLDFGNGDSIKIQQYFDNTAVTAALSGAGNGLIESIDFADTSFDFTDVQGLA